MEEHSTAIKHFLSAKKPTFRFSLIKVIATRNNSIVCYLLRFTKGVDSRLHYHFRYNKEKQITWEILNVKSQVISYDLTLLVIGGASTADTLNSFNVSDVPNREAKK